MESDSDNSIVEIEADGTNAVGLRRHRRQPYDHSHHHKKTRRRRRSKKKKARRDIPSQGFRKELKLNVKPHRGRQRCKISSRGIKKWLTLPRTPPEVRKKRDEAARILQNFSLPCPKNYKIPFSRHGSYNIVGIGDYDDDQISLMADCSDEEQVPRLQCPLSSAPLSPSWSSDDQDILTLCVDEDTSWLTGPIPAFYKN